MMRRLLCAAVTLLAAGMSAQADRLVLLNHWDNPDGTIERGYAGRSLWDWQSLPDSLSPRYTEYAALCRRVGVNGTVLNNVNASPSILRDENLVKVAALADLFRPYGLRVYLSVNFASPMALDSLPTADPLDPDVVRWWREKARRIYGLIPDFGGFLVKANSEGQPGPCDYGRTHADGANMLARALRPHGGIVMWRAFVYSPGDADRAKQAYDEFKPLDGAFDANVIVQIKNGPIDFQPREPYSPLFTAMTSTATMPELQITQEYLGHSNHLAYLGSMWEEFYRYVPLGSQAGVAGVANIGDAANLTGHPFGRANLYAFGLMARDTTLTARDVARLWAREELMPRDTATLDRVVDMMMMSREAVVDYMMPMGLHHLFAWGHHYGPEPWCDVEGARPDWMPRFYHRADSVGLGFDRTSATGSNAVSQYPEPYRSMYDDIDTCPPEYLLWFHHVPWTRVLPTSGDTMWNTLCRHYQRGVDAADRMLAMWRECETGIPDHALWADVEARLITQTRDARWWKDACLLYFQTYSRLPFPADVAPATHTLEKLRQVHLPIDNYTCPSASMLDAVR